MPRKLKFNNVEFSQWFNINVERPMMPESDVNVSEFDGKDGGFFRGRSLKPLTLHVKLRVKNDVVSQISTLRHEIASALHTEGLARLYMPDEFDKYYMACVDGQVPIDRLLTTGLVEIDFVCPDPVAYGASKTATISTTSSSITIGGNYPSKPLLTSSNATKSSSNLWGVRIDNQNVMRVPLEISSAVTARIDCDARTAKVNGSTSMITLDSDWLELSPGSHSIRIDQGSGSATLAWTERWL